MSTREPTVESELLDRVRARLAGDDRSPTPAGVALALRREGGVRGDAELLAISRRLQSEIVGAGPLEPLLCDPAVTDVLVNAADEVWVDRGRGLEPASVRFADEAAVRRLGQRLAAGAGRRLDDASPFVDARLPDGTRLHAVLPPVSPRGVCLSLRVPPRRPFTLVELIAAGTLTDAGAELVRSLVVARVAFLVSGGTGSGKTTLLSSLIGCVDPQERVILVEDSGELLPSCPHVVRLECRPANAEGAGAVSLRDLLRQALRMRPDRIVVGEVRGGEVVDLLAALNTGHEGGCGTVHANNAAEVPARLEALAAAAGMARTALHSQLGAALHVVLHLRRDPAGVRRLGEVGVLVHDGSGLVSVLPALVRRNCELTAGPGAARLVELLLARGMQAAALPAPLLAAPRREVAP